MRGWGTPHRTPHRTHARRGAAWPHLACGVPYLQRHQLVVHLQLFREKIGAYGGLVLLGEFFADILVHEAGFAHAARPQDDHLDQLALAPHAGCRETRCAVIAGPRACSGAQAQLWAAGRECTLLLAVARSETGPRTHQEAGRNLATRSVRRVRHRCARVAHACQHPAACRRCGAQSDLSRPSLWAALGHLRPPWRTSKSCTQRYATSR